MPILEHTRQTLESRVSEDTITYLLKYGQLILTILGIIGVALYIAENPRRMKLLGPTAAS